MHILVLQGHPDAAGGHFCHALADAYVQAARAAGHSVELLSIAALDFPLLRSGRCWETEPLPNVLRAANGALLQAQHVVLVFPLWLGSMPALLKGFLEQVLRPYPEQPATSLALSHRFEGHSARVVVTMGMPAWVYRCYYLSHGVKALSRGVLAFVGMSPVRTSWVGSIDTLSTGGRDRWLNKMRALGRRGH